MTNFRQFWITTTQGWSTENLTVKIHGPFQNKAFRKIKIFPSMAPIQFQIWTVERWTMSDFLPIKSETTSVSFMFTETNMYWSGSVKHFKNYMSKSETWEY